MREHDFLKVASAEHSKFILNISVAVDKLTSSSFNLVTSDQSFASTVKEMQPSIQVLSSATTHIQSLAEPVAAVTKLAKDLKSTTLTSPPRLLNQHAPTTHPTYTGTVSNPTTMTTNPIHPSHNPNQPNYIQHVSNQLCITKKQVYIT